MMMTAVRRILLVEDNRADIELLRLAFDEANIAVRLDECQDGADAKALMIELSRRPREDLPELILLDLNLPRASGREVLAEARRHPELAHIPVVVLTSSAHPADRAACVALGITGYELKPRSLEELAALATRLVGLLDPP